MNQNSVRASCGSTPEIQPADHGMRKTTTSMTMPIEARDHISMVMVDMYVTMGVAWPGFSRRQRARRRITSKATMRLPTTTSASPV